MRVFQAEALQMNFGIAVGQVVMILVGVVQQVRRVHHPHAVAVEGTARGDVQAVHKRLVLVEHSVTVGVFVDRDLVETRLPLRRRRRNFVIDRSQERIAAEHLQPRGIRVLQVLHDPQPPPLVPRHEERLLDVRLGQHQFQLVIVRHRECFQRLVRWHDRRVIGGSLPRLRSVRRCEHFAETRRRRREVGFVRFIHACREHREFGCVNFGFEI